MSKWQSQDSCPGLWDAKAHSLNPSATSFSFLWPHQGRRAIASRPEVPQTSQHILPLCPPTSVYHFPLRSRRGPASCLVGIQMSGKMKSSTCRLSVNTGGGSTATGTLRVSLQHGVGHTQGRTGATQVSQASCPGLPDSPAVGKGVGACLPALLACPCLLFSHPTACPPTLPPLSYCRPPPESNSSFPSELRSVVALDISERVIFFSKHFL